MKKARDYQVEAKNTILRELHENKKADQLLVMATGTGKTFVACDIVQEFKRCLWLTHKEELIDQSALSLLGVIQGYEYHQKIQQIGGYLPFLDSIKNGGIFGVIPLAEAQAIRKKIGVVKAQRMDIESRIVVASVQTMINRLQHFKSDDFDVIISDEAHYALAKGWLKVLNHFRPQLRLGLTATPFRLDGANLATMFGETTFDRDIKYGIDNGWLVEIDAVRVKTELNLDTVARKMGEFNTGELERLVNTPQRNRLIVSKYQEYASGKQALVFAVDVKHCLALHQTFEKAGIKSTFVVADESLCPNRRERFAQFKSGEVQVLVNVDIATTGFDHDMVEVLVMARPTMSLSLYLQMVGRGTRTERGVIDGLETAQERIEAIRNSRKKQLLILDITDNTTRHNLINAHNLDREKEPEDRVFTTKAKIQQILESRKRKLKHHLKQDHKVDLLKLPKLDIYKSGRNLKEATEKQKAVLEREGYDTTGTYYTMYDAAMIISNLPAAEWQLKKLKAMNYDVSKGCTLGQFSKIMQEMANKPKITPVSKQYIQLPFSGLE